MTFTFFGCWLPRNILYTMMVLRPDDDGDAVSETRGEMVFYHLTTLSSKSTSSRWIQLLNQSWFSALISFSNSALAPILYLGFSNKSREILRDLFCASSMIKSLISRIRNRVNGEQMVRPISNVPTSNTEDELLSQSQYWLPCVNKQNSTQYVAVLLYL